MIKKKRHIAMITIIAMCIAMIYISPTVVAQTVSEQIINTEEAEILDFFTEDIGETEEEKEYIVYFNDSVVSLYADEGKDYALMNEEELNVSIDEGIVEFYEETTWVYLYEDDGFDPKQSLYKWDVKMIEADYAFEKGYSGNGIKVAVIDSGCKAECHVVVELGYESY